MLIQLGVHKTWCCVCCIYLSFCMLIQRASRILPTNGSCIYLSFCMLIQHVSSCSRIPCSCIYLSFCMLIQPHENLGFLFFSCIYLSFCMLIQQIVHKCLSALRQGRTAAPLGSTLLCCIFVFMFFFRFFRGGSFKSGNRLSHEVATF